MMNACEERSLADACRNLLVLSGSLQDMPSMNTHTRCNASSRVSPTLFNIMFAGREKKGKKKEEEIGEGGDGGGGGGGEA